MANKRMAFLKKLLEFSGIHPERLRTRWVSSAEAVEFVHEVSEFVEEIKKLGPNPLKGKQGKDKVNVEVQAEIGVN
jgi:F420-non-reducing hydrogenase iron-sulfur subunit